MGLTLLSTVVSIKKITKSSVMPESGPTFSIVIPVYNRAASIMPTLRSCFDQTFQDFEIVVVDDGSTDDLPVLIESLRDPRLHYIRQANSGVSAARNTGIDAACGRYIAFLDSDDLFVPQKLERCAERIMSESVSVAYSYSLVDRGVGRYWVRPSRPIGPNEDMGEYLFVANEHIPIPTVVVARDLARHIRFDSEFRTGEDKDFFLRLHAAGARFTMIEEPLVVWVDSTDEGRLSRKTSHDAALRLLEKMRPLLTRKALIGFRSTVLAYFDARSRPLSALKQWFLGYFIAGVPFKVVVRQSLRAWLPESVYRGIVNLVVTRNDAGETFQKKR